MKFRITMKDPDGPYECIQDEAKKSLKAIEGLSEDDREALHENRVNEMRAFASKWMEYGEYIEVEFDTEAETATVIPCKH